MDFVDIGPECFANDTLTVISYKGVNYYKACDEFVTDRKEGGQSFCVKRIGHPGKIHEAYDGTTREKGVLAAYDVEGNLANGLDKYSPTLSIKTKSFEDIARELANAIRLTVEYVGNDVLPAKEGWSWFDVLDKYYPEITQQFINKPILFSQNSLEGHNE